jgi:quercetin 2,3-dioxygenase
MKLIFSLFTIITTLLTAYDINLASRSILNATTRQLRSTINKTYSRQITTNTMTVPREISKSFLAREQPEGDGATVRRAIGTPQMRNLTPFLMLDEFNSTPEAGFPDHPHRGQETITYVLKGSMDHEDFLGNKGRLGAGDLQFMTAG